MRMHRSLAFTVMVTVVASLAAACGGDDDSSAPTSTRPTSASTSTTTSTAPLETTALSVYLVRDEKLAAAGRSVVGAGSVDAALRALLAGPRGSLERDLGMATAIPAGTTLNGTTVDGAVVTVDLSRSFESGGGSLSMQERVAQVVFTATQFPGLQRVRFELDGTPVTTIGGEGLIVDNVQRTDFENVLPAILVEAPTPGALVTSPLAVRGMSNTFEATVNYTLTDPEGLVLHEGFTTATSGTGTRGTFAFEVPFTTTRAGMGSIIVYEISPRDGARTNLVEVPVRMPRSE